LFAALLPPTAYVVEVTHVDASGRVLEPQDLSFHEGAWQRFLRRQGNPED
jgi:hypothetical protein